MPAPGIVERFKTARHTYTVQRQANGQLVYRKDGKFTSARSINAARAHTTEAQPEGTVRFDSRNDLRSAPLAGVADRVEGEWIAGPDASEYDPSVGAGEFISGEKALQLRRARTQERRFFEFALRQPSDMTIGELRDRFAEWKQALEEAQTPDERRQVMLDFGWEETL